jgi:hypothetical protein
MGSITPQQLLDAHRADVEIQDDQSAMRRRGRIRDRDRSCFSEAASADAVKRSHAKAGHPTDEVYPVPVQA